MSVMHVPNTMTAPGLSPGSSVIQGCLAATDPLVLSVRPGYVRAGHAVYAAAVTVGNGFTGVGRFAGSAVTAMLHRMSALANDDGTRLAAKPTVEGKLWSIVDQPNAGTISPKAGVVELQAMLAKRKAATQPIVSALRTIVPDEDPEMSALLRDLAADLVAADRLYK